MPRASAGFIGLFLGALWVAGSSLHAAAWLTWLDGIAALIAFGIAWVPTTRETEERSIRTVGGGILSLGLFALWIGALVTDVQPWLVWCTFAAAVAMAVLAFGSDVRMKRRFA